MEAGTALHEGFIIRGRRDCGDVYYWSGDAWVFCEAAESTGSVKVYRTEQEALEAERQMPSGSGSRSGLYISVIKYPPEY